MRLQEWRGLATLRSLAISSAMPGDGKSTIALNLATTLAENGKRSVLLIEGDLHLPSLAKALNIPAQPGLAECLENGVDPIMHIRRLKPLQFFMLQSGQAHGNPTELLQSAALPRLLEGIGPYFDWVLIDTPAIAPLTDALTISRYCDGTLLVVRADHTIREAVDDAVSQLGAERLVGIVFNGAEGLNRYYSKYSKYYGRKK